jgi:hypothetical protein
LVLCVDITSPTVCAYLQRYAVLLHRIQAPERSSPPSPPPRPAATRVQAGDDAEAPLIGESAEVEPPRPSILQRIKDLFNDHPGLRGE